MKLICKMFQINKLERCARGMRAFINFQNSRISIFHEPMVKLLDIMAAVAAIRSGWHQLGEITLVGLGYVSKLLYQLFRVQSVFIGWKLFANRVPQFLLKLVEDEIISLYFRYKMWVWSSQKNKFC